MSPLSISLSALAWSMSSWPESFVAVRPHRLQCMHSPLLSEEAFHSANLGSENVATIWVPKLPNFYFGLTLAKLAKRANESSMQSPAAIVNPARWKTFHPSLVYIIHYCSYVFRLATFLYCTFCRTSLLYTTPY